MVKALEILKLFQSDKYKFESGASLWLPEVDKKMKEAIAELEEAMKPKTCEWKYENSTDMWVGECGAEMVFYNNLTPTQEKMHFCYKCGGKLIEIEPKDNA